MKIVILISNSVKFKNNVFYTSIIMSSEKTDHRSLQSRFFKLN